MKLSVARTLLVFANVLFLASSVHGQFETAEVLGTVHDPSGKAVPKASVTLTNQGTGIEAKTSTSDSGDYDFFNVQVGKYKVTVEATGFSKISAPDIDVTVEARQRVDLTLQVGVVTQTVDVTDAATILETDSSEHGQVINTQQVAELPLNGRDYADLALLSTNINKSPIGALFSPSGTPREAAYNVNGMRSTYNNFLLDGLDNNAYSSSNQGYSSQVVQPSPDAINEFKVLTSNFSAEYGRVGGGVINAALRSGTNEFHGTAYEFLRNTDLNATGFIFCCATFQKPTLQRNQFGVTIGGPIIKNKLFFFGDYEGQRQLQRYLNFDSIPDMNDRNAVLINPANGQGVTVYDPLTRALYPSGQIPPSVINTFAQTVLNNLPAPNGLLRSNNLEALLLVRDYYDKYDAKVDYQLNSKMNAFLRFSQRKDIQYYQPDISGPSGGAGNGFIHAIAQQAAAGYTWALTPNSLLEARFGFDHIVAGKTPPDLGGPSMEALYGIAGLPTSTNLTGGLDSQSVSGFSAFGRQSTNPQFQNPTTFDPKLNYTWIKGRHSIKAGYEFVAIRTEVLDVNPLYGSDTYAGQFSNPNSCAKIGLPTGCTLPAAGDSSSYNLADFLFGLPSTIALGNDVVTNQRQHVHSLYVQDDYRVTSKLTLNVGLRWDFATPIWERDNNWTNFNPATNSLIPATNGSLYDRTLVHPDYHDFGPRIGLAYSVDSKTVIRGGYGISYSFFNRVGSALENINGPQIIFGTLTQALTAVGTLPSTFLTTQNSFTTGIDNPANFNPVNANVDYVDPNTRWPMIQNWLLSVQHQFTSNTVVEVAYNGNHSTRLPIIADYNQAVPNLPGQSLGEQARVPDPEFGAITWVDPAGSNNYNGLSVRAEHRMGHGLYLLNSFTWSKALGDSEQALEYFPGYTAANPQNIHNLAAEYGPSSFDIKLIDVTSVVYQLPFGKGRQFATGLSPVAEALFGGWEVNAVDTAHTGPAINVNYSPSSTNDVSGSIADYRGLAVLRPNVSGSSTSQNENGEANTYFAGYTFSTPPSTDPFGDAGRNAFRGPGLWQLDTGIDKSFAIHEKMRLQFRSEFFNIFNKTNFSPPTATTTSSAFGTIRSTYAPRQIQFALKLVF